MSEQSLGDLVASGVLEVNDGYRTKRPELGLPGVPILRVAEVLDGRLAPTFGDHIREEFRPMFRRKASMAGDVVVTTKGTVGRVARIPAQAPEFVYSPQVCFFRVHRPDVLDPGWLYQWLKGPHFRRQVLTVQDQTDMAAYINLVDLRATRIDLPPLSEQRAVGEVLAAVDDKIAANRRLIAVCDESWLVALRGEEQGHPVPLSSLARFVNGRAFTKGASGTGRMVIRIAELNSGPGSSTVYNDLDVGQDHVANAGDLLFAWSGSLTVTRWSRDEGIINQHIFKVLPNEGVPTWFVHGRILELLEYFRGVAADKATTMGHIQRHHLDELVLMPPPDVLARLDELCGPLWTRALKAEQENLSLAELRDVLLPSLLAGEVRVRDGGSLVGEPA